MKQLLMCLYYVIKLWMTFCWLLSTIIATIIAWYSIIAQLLQPLLLIIPTIIAWYSKQNFVFAKKCISNTKVWFLWHLFYYIIFCCSCGFMRLIHFQLLWLFLSNSSCPIIKKIVCWIYFHFKSLYIPIITFWLMTITVNITNFLFTQIHFIR